MTCLRSSRNHLATLKIVSVLFFVCSIASADSFTTESECLTEAGARSTYTLTYQFSPCPGATTSWFFKQESGTTYGCRKLVTGKWSTYLKKSYAFNYEKTSPSTAWQPWANAGQCISKVYLKSLSESTNELCWGSFGQTPFVFQTVVTTNSGIADYYFAPPSGMGAYLTPVLTGVAPVIKTTERRSTSSATTNGFLNCSNPSTTVSVTNYYPTDDFAKIPVVYEWK